MVETPGGGSQPKSEEQPHAIAYAPGIEMPSPNPERSTVPSTSDVERPVPDARRNVTGAPKGNKNAFKHGRYTAEAIGQRREISELVRDRLLGLLDESFGIGALEEEASRARLARH